MYLLFLFRRFGTKCSGCSQGISPTDLVRRARNKVFHLKCFTCLVCRKQLSTGEELYVLDENRFICKEDYLSSRHGPGKKSFLYFAPWDDIKLNTHRLKQRIAKLLYIVTEEPKERNNGLNITKINLFICDFPLHNA